LNQKQNSPDETGHDVEMTVDYLEEAPQPLPARSPIGPPDVQPGETPIGADE